MEAFFNFWTSTFLSQFLSRILSFASNQVLVRLLTPDLFGIWCVRLSLIYETILFWAREGPRKAAAKSAKDDSSFYRYALFPIMIGLIFSPIVIFITYSSAPDVEGFMFAALMTVLCSNLELIGEIWAVPQLAQLQPKPSSRVVAICFLVKSVVTVVLTKLFYKTTYNLMIIFGLSYLLYGVLVVVLFFAFCGRPYFEMPTRKEIRELRPFAFQTVLQWLFSQGERMILIAITTPSQIGVYGLVSDLCALVARIIFAPIEMSVYNLCASKKNPPVDVITILTRVVLYIALFAAAFGPHIGPPLLQIVYGEKWSTEEAKDVLSAFCRVMPFIALNGISEAFPNARLEHSKLERYNVLLALINGLYLGLTYLFGKMNGPVGAIYANGIAMTIRSIMAIIVIFRECGPLWNIFPNAGLLLGFGFLSALGGKMDIKVMFGLVPVFGSTVLFLERNTISSILTILRPKKN